MSLMHREFLEPILQDELLVPHGSQLSRRITTACFRDKRDIFWLGPLGAGKSLLRQSIGIAAIRAGITVYYRSILDTVGDLLAELVN